MPERPGILLREYETTELLEEQLTHADLARLQALQKQRKLTVSRSRVGWRISVDATVGIIPLDRVRLVIRPKLNISGKRLIDWLCYSLATPVPHLTALRRWSTSPTGFTDLIAAALLEECRSLLRAGLRQDYVRRRSIEPVLRGRLDIRAQATRRYGLVDRLHVETFDREVDIWENQVCGAALTAAAPLANDDTLARALTETSRSFPRVSPPAAVRALTRAHYTRLNSRYRIAHTWARLVLTGGGVDDLLTEKGPQQADSLLVDMPTMWEQAVRRMAQEAAAPRGGVLLRSSGAQAITTTGDISTRPPFRPDVLLGFPAPGPEFVPVDAKYKGYSSKSVSAEDVHQLLTYTAGYSSSAVLAHPDTTDTSLRTLRIRAPNGLSSHITVAGLDISKAPERSLIHLRHALAVATGFELD